ncbi:MAG: TIGR02300 family protein [Pelagerythrobacter marensis]|uniref:TIGR02300 family protein n=1 Tax=Qipengyuania sp. YIM B01966 TaxID=2778646 RepID=UPI000DB1EA85|nr:TIGR02300 family protein [Qipengyuania sp. YIM B01966]PZO70279.1 MAG: TIGR02300 family protein [Pelagerythrobacter marensis]PZU18448.1 MAG: TIGR02300 family protein [Citromicrobium sp.]
MVKAEWGTKRSCPKCGTRFYDLGKDEPVQCIECSEQWFPEPVLKSKQPIPFDDPKKADKEADADSDLGGDDLDDIDVDDDQASPDADVDLGGDDDLGVDTGNDEDEDH